MEIQRVLRQEKKYILNTEQRMRMEARLEKMLRPDPHNEGVGYMVRSLYFDTMTSRDFYDKLAGVELRRKMRMRIYHPEDEYAMLEIKQKQVQHQLKRSMRITRKEAMQMERGDYTPLRAYDNEFAAEYYSILTMNQYRPAAIVEYHRKAYILPENAIRITFDTGLTASEGRMSIFEAQPGLYPVIQPWKAFLEIKYNHFLLSYVKELLNMCDDSEMAVSKYCLSRRQSLHRSESI